MSTLKVNHIIPFSTNEITMVSASLTGSITNAENAESASFATTSSFALRAEEGGFPFTGSAEISGSLTTDILQVNSDITIPSGTPDERLNNATTGSFRYNTTMGWVEFYDGTLWQKILSRPVDQFISITSLPDISSEMYEASLIEQIVPSWTTSAGNIGTTYTERSETVTVTATTSDSSNVTYSLISGNLPTNYTLDTTTGDITGTGSGITDYSSTDFTFTIRATSITGHTSDREFTITLSSRYVGYRCTEGGENATLSDTAPSGMVFNRVDFSSYGTPNGSCGSYTLGSCHSTSSGNYDPTPTTSYSVSANNGTWGDPCGGTGKRMRIQMSYGPF